MAVTQLDKGNSFRAWAGVLNAPRSHSTRAVPRANATVSILMPGLLATEVE